MAGKRRKDTRGSRPSPLSLRNSFKAEEIIFSNVDLLTEILLRLPAVSVVRFKCVAKLWRTIISDPKFQTSHTKLNPTSVLSGQYVDIFDWTTKDLLAVPFGSNRSLPSLSFIYSLWSGIELIDSCNGLFLFELNLESYVVCNPTTQSYKILPKLTPPKSDHFLHISYFPSKSIYYKVVTLDCWGSRMEFQIYSSDRAAWKKVVRPFPTSFTHSRMYSRIVSWNGAVHWMCGENDISHFRFDLDEEELEVVQLPPKPKILGCGTNLFFGECGGRLFLVQARDTKASGFRILEMGEGCSGWIVKHHRFNLKSAFPEVVDRLMIRDFRLHCVNSGGDEETTEIVLRGNGKVISYNLKSKTLKLLCSFPTYEWIAYEQAFQYHASLLVL